MRFISMKFDIFPAAAAAISLFPRERKGEGREAAAAGRMEVGMEYWACIT
jgi:hypothetical protein